MRFIHCADFHIDSPLSYLTAEEDQKDKKDSLLVEFRQMVSYARDHAIDAVLISGDLFDSDYVSRTAAFSVRQIIADSPAVDFYYLRGNHDKSGIFRSDMKPDNLFCFGDSWTYYEPLPGITISGIETDGLRSDAASELELLPDDFNLVMLHGNPDDFGNLAHRNIDYLAMGHIHKPSSRKIDNRARMVYPGCPMGRGWDETGPRGFVVLDVNDHSHYFDFHFVDFASSHFYRFEADVTGCSGSEEMLKKIQAALAESGESSGILPSFDDRIRVDLTGTLDPDAEKNRAYITASLKTSYRHIELSDHTRIRAESLDAASGANGKGIRSRFINLVMNDKDLDPAMQNEVLETGLRLLGGDRL